MPSSPRCDGNLTTTQARRTCRTVTGRENSAAPTSALSRSKLVPVKTDRPGRQQGPAALPASSPRRSATREQAALAQDARRDEDVLLTTMLVNDGASLSHLATAAQLVPEFGQALQVARQPHADEVEGGAVRRSRARHLAPHRKGQNRSPQNRGRRCCLKPVPSVERLAEHRRPIELAVPHRSNHQRNGQHKSGSASRSIETLGGTEGGLLSPFLPRSVPLFVLVLERWNDRRRQAGARGARGQAAGRDGAGRCGWRQPPGIDTFWAIRRRFRARPPEPWL